MNESAIELAAYTVKNEKRYETIQRDMHEMVSGWQGYVGSLRLHSIGNPTAFADILLWKSSTEAKAAATMFDGSDDPVAVAAKQEFVDMKVFGHFVSESENNVLSAFVSLGTIVEIAADYPKDVSAYTRVQTLVHSALHSEIDGIIASEILRGDDGDKGTCLVDLISWETPEHMQKAFEELSSDERFMSFFAANGEPILCELYKVVGVHGAVRSSGHEAAA